MQIAGFIHCSLTPRSHIMPKRKQDSHVWEHFTKNDDTGFCSCRLPLLSKAQQALYSHQLLYCSSLWYHLKNKHPNELWKTQTEPAAKKPASIMKQTLLSNLFQPRPNPKRSGTPSLSA